MVYIILFLTFVGLIFLAHKYMKASSELKKYRPLVDINKEIEVKGKQVADIKSKLEKLNISFESVKKEVQLLNDDHDLLSAGFYKSKYNFGDASKYEEKIDSIRTRQKELIKEKEAIICKTEWTVGGSKAEGKKMTDRIIKLGLSAFNVQCDNEILRVKFDNIDRAEEKMTKIRENVNKLLEPNQCEITEKFFKLKLEELFLAYEYQEQVQKEKEEQKQIREQMRDDEKARRELERVQAEAEREEKRYAQALEKARADLTQKSDAEKESFMLKIAALEDKLKEAHENKERAKSQAEMTKRGYVYVISNIGSFGENVYKIGMTRRLDPMDRVWELGDASVPFDFDVHAMIHSEDAPNLERRLHEAFNHRRVNQVNERKEFFRVPLSEIEQASRKIHNGEFKLTLLAEAKEYRQTVAMQNENIDKKAA